MWQKNVRYLDYNASSGLSKAVRENLIGLLQDPEILANPSSRHRLGQRSSALIYQATLKIAKSLSGLRFESISPDDLFFTSSGTEANQTILKSIFKQTPFIIVGAGEHSASFDWGQAQTQTQNGEIKELSLLPDGQYNFSELEEILANAKKAGVKCVGLSLALANNETGVLLDVEKLKAILKKTDKKNELAVILHLDAAQVWGKHSLDFEDTSAQYLSFSAHKIGAPAGTGLIWMRRGNQIDPLLLGTQSKGNRGGTENLIGIIATGFAAEALNSNEFEARTRPLVKRLEEGLKQMNYPVKIWGEESLRVSNTSRFSFQEFKTYENWVELLDLKGFAVSHGSACKAQVIEPSRVLLKMGATKDTALNSLRISFGPNNSLVDAEDLLLAIQEILSKKLERKVESHE